MALKRFGKICFKTAMRWFWKAWRLIAKPLTLMITGMAMMFLMTGYRGIQSDNYVAATILVVLSYGWMIFMFWLNFIRDTIWDK